MIYVACPWSHPDARVRGLRCLAATRYTAQLVAEGEVAFSPLTHSVPVVEEGERSGLTMPHGWTYWARLDERVLALCDCIHVLMLPGWEESEGVAREMEAGLRWGVPIVYVKPSEGASSDVPPI